MKLVRHIIVDREGMGADFLAGLVADGRAVATVLRADQYTGLDSFTEVGTFVPLVTMRGRDGQPTLEVRQMRRIVEQLVTFCAARKLVPAETGAHTLRHTFATSYLADHPGDLVGLAALLGHDSIETSKIYVQPSQDDLDRRVEATRLNAFG